MDLIPHPSNGEMGAILEVFNALGESISVVTFGVVGFRLNKTQPTIIAYINF